MLKKRVMTAAIMVPLVLGVILFAHPFVLLGLMAFVYVLELNEWARLVPVTTVKRRHLFFALAFVAAVVCVFVYPVWLVLGLIIWLLVVLAVLTYPVSEPVWGRPLIVMTEGLILLPLASVSAGHIYLTAHGAWLVIYAIALVGLSDTGAYFMGKKYLPLWALVATAQGVMGRYCIHI